MKLIGNVRNCSVALQHGAEFCACGTDFVQGLVFDGYIYNVYCF